MLKSEQVSFSDPPFNPSFINWIFSVIELSPPHNYLSALIIQRALHPKFDSILAPSTRRRVSALSLDPHQKAQDNNFSLLFLRPLSSQAIRLSTKHLAAMSNQYDTIQAPYDYIRKKSIAIIEHENVQTTVAPLIKNARVLELACGSGFYKYDFLK